ncbi:MAG TPA: hypothetical protein DGT21_03290 [Armatimonadetes bacterium]|nr:hypothetical protein [Armatimonadota bacterium]
MPGLITLTLCAALVLVCTGRVCAQPAGREYAIPLRVTSNLPCPNVPMDPVVDFAAAITEAGIDGVLDPNSIAVIDARTGEAIPHALTEDFAYGDTGRVEWVIGDASHRDYEIRFRTAATRPPLQPAEYTPMIGTGDLLRYNAGVPRPISLCTLSGLADLTGDGNPDLVGCWNYAYRPGWPWSGIVCYPRVGDGEQFEFGDLFRLRYVEPGAPETFMHPHQTYMSAEVADLNGDGLPDLIYCPAGDEHVYVYLHTGRRDAGGMPVFEQAAAPKRHTSAWEPCRAVDVDGDGAIDLVIGKQYLRNTNPNGWPMELADPVQLPVGEDVCFLDIDGDGRLDAVSLADGPEPEPRAKYVVWQPNLGGTSPRFGEPVPLPDIDAYWCSRLAAVNEGPHRGILVQHDVYQRVSFYEQTLADTQQPRFRHFGEARSLSAVMSLSDQAWPCACDFDGDGDWDLVVGGGYGWPRVVINKGATDHAAFAEARQIQADGEPIRLLRDDILGGKHWHNMGYPYPAFVDWDGDGLPDLVFANETNRIYWYRNIGTREQPAFGSRQQIICDGYEESQEKLRRSAELAADRDLPQHPYPYEEDQPFYWRTGPGFGDLNGDGLMDMITHDGHTRKLTLFVQYRDGEGALRLRKERPLTLVDGRLIDDSVVERASHWTESFRCVDWDGDGLLDVIYSCSGTEPEKGSIYLLRNCGTPTEPVFEPPVTLCCFGEPIKVTTHGPHPAVADIDGDGRPDILACVEWSVYPFYCHAAIQMPRRPEYELGPVKTL